MSNLLSQLRYSTTGSRLCKMLFHIYINISIFRLRFYPCPILWGWQHQAMSNTGSPSICLVGERQPGHTYWHRSHTCWYHVFLGFPCFLVLRIGMFVIDLIKDLAHWTWPYHLSCQQQRADIISLMPSFCSSEAEGVSSLSPMPQIQQIKAQSLLQGAAVQGYLVPRFTTMEHSWVKAGLVHLAAYPW